MTWVTFLCALRRMIKLNACFCLLAARQAVATSPTECQRRRSPRSACRFVLRALAVLLASASWGDAAFNGSRDEAGAPNLPLVPRDAKPETSSRASAASPRRAALAATCSPYPTAVHPSASGGNSSLAALLAFNITNASPLPVLIYSIEFLLSDAAATQPGAVAVFLLRGGIPTAQAVLGGGDPASAAAWTQVFYELDWPPGAPPGLVVPLSAAPDGLRTVNPGAAVGVAIAAASAAGAGSVQCSVLSVAAVEPTAPFLGGAAAAATGGAAVRVSEALGAFSVAGDAAANRTRPLLLAPGAAQGLSLQPAAFSGGAVIYRTLCSVRFLRKIPTRRLCYRCG